MLDMIRAVIVGTEETDGIVNAGITSKGQDCSLIYAEPVFEGKPDAIKFPHILVTDQDKLYALVRYATSTVNQVELWVNLRGVQ